VQLNYSADPYCTSAYSADMHWSMMYQCEGLGLPCRQVASNLNVDPSTVSRVVSGFNGARMELSVIDELVIMENILERPDMYLHELQSGIRQTTSSVPLRTRTCYIRDILCCFCKIIVPCRNY